MEGERNNETTSASTVPMNTTAGIPAAAVPGPSRNGGNPSGGGLGSGQSAGVEQDTQDTREERTTAKRQRPTPFQHPVDENEERLHRLKRFLPLVLSTATNGLDNYWQSVFHEELCKVECVLAQETSPVSMESGEANTRLSSLVKDIHVWFGMESIMVSLVILEQLAGISRDSRILDVGCGNGYFCESLRAMGYKHVVGVDKSENAIKVASFLRPLHEAACVENGTPEVPDSGITFEHADIVKDSDNPFCAGPYDVIYDKGTLDAVGMVTPEDPPDPSTPPLQLDTVSKPVVDYAQALSRALAPGGCIVLVSCAFNKEEIKFLFPQLMIAQDMSDFFENGLLALALRARQ